MARFDLNLLGALDALLTEQNVTRAAEVLNVTQPTMSGMLQRLRYQFEDPLLVRNGRGMVLTHFAASLVEPVREAIKGVESLVRPEPTFDPARSTRSFTIMASDYCASILIPRVIARMTKIAPGMRLVMQAPNAPIERILAGDVDVCITTNERSEPLGPENDERIQSEQLFSDAFVCVVSVTHPLRPGASREAYFKFPHVMAQMAGVASAIIAAHGAHVAGYKPAFSVADFSLIPHMVASTDAVGIVPERLARIAARTLQIKAFPPPIDLPKSSESMRWHARHAEDPAHVWLRAVLIEEARTWTDVDARSGSDIVQRKSRMSGEARNRSTALAQNVFGLN